MKKTALVIILSTILALIGLITSNPSVNAETIDENQFLSSIVTNYDFQTYTIENGAYHSAAVIDGRIFVWGSNEYGKLGDGTTIDKYTPTEVTDQFNLGVNEFIQSVSLGYYHSAAITNNGRIFTWGRNHEGQLGDGTTIDQYTPKDITDQFILHQDEIIISVFLGVSHSSAITNEGRIFTWGYNYYGQLGEGTTTSRYSPVDITSEFNLGETEFISSISLGYYHSSAITNDGRVFTWGRNYYGQLGDNTIIDRHSPVEITSQFTLGSSEVVLEMALGYERSLAITNEGRIFSWGRNSTYGFLGDGTTEDRHIPTDITSQLGLDIEETISHISMGYQHSSLITSQGKIFVWGINDYGQLGTGSTNPLNTPYEITYQLNLLDDEKIISVNLGAFHTSIITNEGRIFTWGWNNSGQLGYEDLTQSENPVEITNLFILVEVESITQITSGYSHHAATTSFGRVFTWGNNSYGQLGDGTTISRLSATEITNQFGLSRGEKIVQVALGSDSSGMTHSSAITSEGRIFTWGYNGYGQLGDGTTNEIHTPNDITDQFSLIEGEKITSISLGRYHSLALTNLGRVFTWGRNNYGQLGDGTTVDSNSPNDITNEFLLNEGEIIICATLGNDHSSALTSEGRMFTWGKNSSGELGDGTTINHLSPTDITNEFDLNIEEKIVLISLGGGGTLAISNEGRILTWGWNYDGQLGDGTNTTKYSPIDITNQFNLNQDEIIINGLFKFHQVSAITNEGRIFTWGWNGYGVLGDGTDTSHNVPTEITTQFSLNAEETITSISFGSNNTSAISSEGKIFTWGAYFNGGLGDGTNVNRLNPAEISGHFNLNVGETIILISQGSSSTIVKTSLERVYVWGNNFAGQLGDGTTINRPVPYEITDQFDLNVGEVIEQLAKGSGHSAALTSEGRVFIWGYNYYGQLGDGTTTNQLSPVEITNKFNLAEGETVISIMLAGYNSAAITSEGRVFTWGLNTYGQLGDGTATHKYVPTEITSQFYLNPEEFIVSMEFASASVLAITSEGRVFTWGKNDFGQLGNGETGIFNPTPIDITSQFGFSLGETIVMSSLGASHGLIFTSEERVLTWGYNNHGQLGDGTTINKLSPIDITSQLQLDQGEVFRTIVLGSYHSEVLTSEGRILTWGWNDMGQLGDGTTNTRLTPVEVTNNFILNENEMITFLSTNGHFSIAITNQNRTFTWGYNSSSQLGDGTMVDSLLPIEIEIMTDSTIDLTPPTFDPIDDQIIEIGAVDIDWSEYIMNAEDDQDGEMIFTEEQDNINYNILGIYSVTVRVTDESGNYSEQTFSVTVIDSTAPTFDFIEDQKIEAGSNDIDWSTYISNANDISNGELTFIEVEDNVNYGIPGVYGVTVKLVDESLNETAQTFNVSVTDTLAPCFDEIASQYFDEGTITESDWLLLLVNLTDNSDGVIFYNVVMDNVDFSVPGEYYVVIVAFDESYNLYSQAFSVFIVDKTKPEFDIVDQTIEAGTEDVDWTKYIENISDNSNGLLVTSEISDNVDYDTPGIYTATVRVTDSAGNYQEKTINITVVDTTPPVYDITIEAGLEDIDWTDFISNISDNSDGLIVSAEVDDNVLYNVPGTYTVTLSVTDESNNARLTTLNITVQDTTSPNVSLNPSMDSILVGNTYTEYGVTATDITETTVLISGEVDINTPGTYVLTYSVTDTSGNITTLLRYVTVYSNSVDVSFELGDAVTSVEQGDNYIDGSCTVSINGFEYECSVKENNVDTSISGIYTIIYSYTYNNHEYTYKRYVFVTDGTVEIQLAVPIKKEDGERI